MGDVVIRAEGLGKKYVIGHQSAERPDTLRDMLSQQVRGLLRSARDIAAGRALVVGDEREDFWALRDVNFEIKRGEVVGIIGRNGAGKSTLLKVLSRITQPTEGRVTIDGRVASLLEVGTGFHPELTGRENIYLNGAILGMTRAEIRRKFDEIVDFSGVEKFLDTPVKRYSSGMYVRLGFSVAAHLEPEILVVDEVLAVGDAEFQNKCLGKIQDVAGGGRTVLFVSHNINMLRLICSDGILLDSGRVEKIDTIQQIVSHYMASTVDAPMVQFKSKLLRIELELKGRGSRIEKSQAIELVCRIELQENNPDLHIGYALYARGLDKPLWWSFFGDRVGKVGMTEGRKTLLTTIPPYLLNDGEYEVELLVAEHGVRWLRRPNEAKERIKFKIEGGIFDNSLLTGTSRPTALFPVFDWRHNHA